MIPWLIWSLSLASCTSRLTTEAGSRQSAPAAALSVTTAATPGAPLIEPTPTLENVSPKLASEFIFPTPTPRAQAAADSADDYIALWPDAIPTLTPGQTARGVLRPAAGLLLDGTYFDAYQFTAQPGDYITLTLTSDAFDPILFLYNSQDELIALNDDWRKDDPNARLHLAIAAPDTYRVIVNSFDVAQGAYALVFSQIDRRATSQILTLDRPARGWLLPGDAFGPDGLLADSWTFSMPDVPIVIWATSDEFDLRLAALDAAGHLLVKNGDMDPIGREFDARLWLDPTGQTAGLTSVAPGSLLTLTVSLQGEFAVGGAYRLLASPLPADLSTPGQVILRPVIVKGADGQGGAQTSETQIRQAVEFANQVWGQCGLHISLEDDQIQSVNIPGLEYTVAVQPIRDIEWTPEENALMSNPIKADPLSGVITIFYVRKIQGSDQLGYAYPPTRYAGGRSGIILISDNGAGNPDYLGTLAHELGHILGLNHPDLDDGDAGNDTVANIMFTGEGMPPGRDLTGPELALLFRGISPLQCAVARATPHFIHSVGPDFAAPLFKRTDRVLWAGDSARGALTTRDALAGEGEQFLDVFYFYGVAGQVVTIDLTAEAFDPYLILEDSDGARLAEDDDSGDEWNARLELTVPVTGDYTLGVTSVERAVGAYQLHVTGQP